MLSQEQVMAFNECIADIEDFLDLFDNKSSHFQNFDMGVLEEGDGFCVETDYLNGTGFPRYPSKMMLSRLYVARDLSDYLSLECSFPVDRVKNDGRIIKQLFMLAQNRFQLTDEELFFALDKEFFTAIVSVNVNRFYEGGYSDFLEVMKYVLDCTMHMLTNDVVENKEVYVNAVSEQI